MKDERKTEIRVGITVLLAIIGMLWIVGWAKNASLNSSRLVLGVRFPSVSGLSVGDQVTLNGVKKGYVDKIFQEPSGVVIDLSLDPDVKIKRDARFSIDMLDLMGGKKVEILPGIASEVIDYKQIAEGDFSADIPVVMKTVGAFSKNIPPMLKSIDSSLAMVNKMLTEESNQKNLQSSLIELKQITLKVNSIIDKNQGEITALIHNSNSLITETKEVIDKNKSDIGATIKQANELTQNANKVVSRIDDLFTETKAKKNNIGKVLYDDSLITKIKDITTSFQKVIDILNTQLNGKGVKIQAKVDLF